MPKLESEVELQNRIQDANTSEEVINILQEVSQYDLGTKTLGIAFEKMFITNNFSPEILISDLENIHHSFYTHNGATWRRKDVSYLGKKYNVISIKEGIRTSAVKIEGLNRGLTIQQNIPEAIRTVIVSQRCRILDIGTLIECDHKDGYKNLARMQNAEQQTVDDYQPLSKAANDAKRSHCIRCQHTHKRYDARNLGYSVGWTVGNEDTRVCQGCYWHDPKEFNSLVSAGFTPTDA